MLGCLAIIAALFGASRDAAAQPIDRWHYIDAESVLHAPRVDGLQGAGIIQNDAIFAMLYLGLPEENGVISIVLPTPEPAAELKSTLVSTRGQRFERVLRAEDLDIVRTSDSSHAYSFPISAIDIDLFKRAQTWMLTIGDTTWPVTLRGSRKAIEEAERRHMSLFKSLATAPAGKLAVSD